VSVVKNATLLLEGVLDAVGAGEDLLQSQADFVGGGESGDLTAMGDIYKDGEHYDDGQTDEKGKKMFGHAACSWMVEACLRSTRWTVAVDMRWPFAISRRL
jgi:hypothetical protein